MRITSREKLFLTIAFIAVLTYICINFIIDPLSARNKVLVERLDELKLKETQLQDAANQEKTLDVSIGSAYDEIGALAKGYFNTTPQEEMILLINDLFESSKVIANSLSFPEPQVVTVGSTALLNTTVAVEFTSNYDALMNLLNTMWEFPKKIQVVNINMQAGDVEGALSGSVSIQLTNLLVDAGIVDHLYTWYIDELFSKENPFEPFTKYNDSIRYIYTGDGANLFNFDRFETFTDVSGHWLEIEMNNFLKLGYVYMNEYRMFGPDKPITRGEFIVLLDNVYQWENTGEAIDLTKFTDYNQLGDLEASYAKAIQKGFISGFLIGYEDNTLRPSAPITYSEVALIMKRIKNDESFTWEKVATDITNKKGITSEKWLDLSDSMTKAEAVYLLTYHK